MNNRLLIVIILIIIAYLFGKRYQKYKYNITFFTMILVVLVLHYNNKTTILFGNQLGGTISTDALANLASMYQDGHLQIQNLTVTGALTASGATINGVLNADDATIKNKLTASGATTINNRLTVGAIQCNDTLNVINATTLNTIKANNANIGEIHIRENRVGKNGGSDIRFDNPLIVHTYGTGNYGSMALNDINATFAYKNLQHSMKLVRNNDQIESKKYKDAGYINWVDGTTWDFNKDAGGWDLALYTK
jgi:hypothetical protein